MLQGLSLQPLRQHRQLHSGADAAQCIRGGFRLVPAQISLAVTDLPLQVRQLHLVTVDKHEMPHPGRSQIHSGRSAQTTKPHHEHAGCEQP